MKINAKRRLLSLIIAFLMVFTYVPATAYATETENSNVDSGIAVAAEGGVTVLDEQIRIVDSLGNVDETEGVVNLTAPGSPKVSGVKTNSVTIYNDSNKYIVLSFKYKAENYGAFSETDTVESITIGTKSGILKPNEYISMSIKGINSFGENTAKLELYEFELNEIPEYSDLTFEYDESLGIVKVNDDIVSNGHSKPVNYLAGGELVAEPVEGSRFIGWINTETSELVSSELIYVINPVKSMNIEAAFVGENSKSYYLIGNKYIENDFNAAIEKTSAVSNKVVVLLNDDTLTAGDYVVPSGVTFLIPFDKENSLYTTADDTSDPVAVNEAYGQGYETPVPYCTLTLAEGANLIVNGKVSLSAKHYAASKYGKSSAPTGDVSFLVTENNSNVIVNDGGKLYSYGYIIGDGEVTAKSGSTIYEMFQIEDFRNGHTTMEVAFNNMDKRVMPITQYYIQNIEVPLNFETGAQEYVYASLHAQNRIFTEKVPFIGGEGAMFNLINGSAVKSYDGSTDRLNVDVDGDIKLAPVSVTAAGNTLDSKNFDLAINSNISVNINSGTTEVCQNLALLPGAEIFIDEDASCAVGEGNYIIVYDLDQWGGFVGPDNEKLAPVSYSPTKSYTRTEADLADAAICVEGLLDATKGSIYTTTSKDGSTGGANIFSIKKGVVNTGIGKPLEAYQFIQEADSGSFETIKLDPANLKNADNSYVQTFETETGTYTYTDGVWMCGHEIIKEVQTKDPTCTEYGEKVITCAMEDVQAGYGHVYTVKIDKLPHTPVTDKGYDATCTEAGLTDGSHCDVCKETLKEQEPIEKLGHKWGDEYVYDVAPTCTEKGSGTIRCERCKVEKEDSAQFIEPLGHSYKWEIIDPTCEDEGKKIGTCTRDKCNHKVEKTLPAAGHDYVPVVTEPTCEEGGYTTYTCSMCDDSYTDDETSKLGHVEVQAAAKDATCTEDGHAAGTYCDRCKETLSGMEPVKALEHKLGEWVEDTAPTCTEKGSKHRDCVRCDFVEKAVIKATGHNEKIMAAVAATCTETGLTEGVRCDVCEKVLIEQEVVPVVEHEAVKDKAVAPTCTETGLTEGSHCDVCGKVLVGQEVVPALDHDYSKKTVAPTCTEDGYTEYTCGRCDDTYKGDIVKTEGHVLITDKAVAPTCTETGLTEGSHCDVCGEVLVEQTVVEATGHDLEHFDGKEPTCTVKGHEPYEACKVCSYTTYKEIPVKEHDYEEHVVKATCTADGYTVKYCACGDEVVIEGEKATGHLFKEYVEVSEGTCVKLGKEKAECAHGCGAVDVKETELGSHKPAADAGKAATCTESGFTAGKYCTVCEKWVEGHEKIAATNHADAVVDAGKAATCTESGFTAGKYCPDCEKWIEGHELVAATNHADATADAGKAATCIESGLTAGKYCPDCDKWIEGHEVIDAAGHKYGEKQFKVPTSKESGGYYEVCSVCDHTNWIQVQTYKAYVKAGVNAISLKTTANASVKSETITVKWTNSSDFGITYYNVYRSTTGKDGSFKYYGKSTVKSFVDKKAEPGQKYYYKVVGYREVEGSTYKTKTSNTVSAKIKKVTAQYVKESKMYITTYNVAKGVKVTWTNPRIKVDAYEVWTSTAKNGKYKKLKTVKGNVYQATHSKLKLQSRHFYKVRGYKIVNGKKVYTKWSALGYRYVLNARDTKLANAINGTHSIEATKAVKVNKGIKVTWTKTDNNAKVTKYRVYRATSKNGTYKQIATTSNKYYVDNSNLQKGKRYYYKIQGYRYFGKALAKTKLSNAVSGIK